MSSWEYAVLQMTVEGLAVSLLFARKKAWAWYFGPPPADERGDLWEGHARGVGSNDGCTWRSASNSCVCV